MSVQIQQAVEGADFNGPNLSVSNQVLACESPKSLIPTRPVSPCSPPLCQNLQRNAQMIHGSPLISSHPLDFTGMAAIQQDTGKEMNGLSLVALLENVLENKEKKITGKKDGAIGRSIPKMTIRTTRPHSSSSEPCSDDENVDLTRRPQKRHKTGHGNGFKKMEASGKHHAVLGGKVFQASDSEDGTKIPDKYINLLMDKLN